MSSRNRAMEWAVGAAVGLAVLHLSATILWPRAPANQWLTNGVFGAAAALCVWRAAISRVDRAAWLCFAAGLVLWTLGDRYYALFLNDLADPPTPSPADVGYLAFYPLTWAGVVLLLRRRVPRLRIGLVLDALVAGLAVVALASAFVFPDALSVDGSNVSSTVVNLAYPIGDLLLIGMLVAGANIIGWRHSGPLLVIAVGLTLFVAGDAVYLQQAAAGTYTLGTPIDALWAVGAVLVGVAAWGSHDRLKRRQLGTPSLVPLVVFSVSALALEVVDTITPLNQWAHLLAAATLLAAVGRMAIAVHTVQQAQAERDASVQMLRSVTETIDEIVWEADARGRVRYVNRMLEPITGWTLERLESDPTAWPDILHPEDRDRVIAALPDIFGDGLDEQFRITRPDGTVRWLRARSFAVRDDTGRIARVVGAALDVTAEHEARSQIERDEQRYRHLAMHDQLTNLPNRAMFLELLAATFDRGEPATILMLDIDRFTEINDALGQRAGDAVLISAAQRLSGCLRGTDTVARFGGDEFAVLLLGAGSEADVACARRMLDAISEPMVHEGRTILAGASVGIAAPLPADLGPDAMLLRADLAMNEAKTAGGHGFMRYDEALEQTMAERQALSDRLTVAISSGELVAWYQPIRRLSDDRIVALESLVRWQHPERGLLPPSEFLDMIEETGAMVALGQTMLRQAVQITARWNVAAPWPVSVHVNCSPSELGDPGLVPGIREALAASGLDPHRLVIEVTEMTIVADLEQAVTQLKAIRALGVRIALDDFGTGYSSLGYLRDLPVFSILKLDRSLISIADHRDRAILRTAVDLAHSLTLEIVAEGIETPAQHALVSELGCEMGQGYLLGRPCDPVATGVLLDAGALPAQRPESAEAEPLQPDSGASATAILVVDDHLPSLELLGVQLQRSGYRVHLALTSEEGRRIAIEAHPDLILIDLNMPGTDGPELARALHSDPSTVGIPLLACSITPLADYRGGEFATDFDGELGKPVDRTGEQLGAQIEAFLAAHTVSAAR